MVVLLHNPFIVPLIVRERKIPGYKGVCESSENTTNRVLGTSPSGHLSVKPGMRA